MRRLHLPIAAALLPALLSSAHAQWWNPADTTPPKYQRMEGYKPVYTRDSLEHCRRAVASALFAGDFTKIERMYAEFMATGARASDGTWMVEAMQGIFDDLFRGFEPAMGRKTFADWEAQVPDSKLRPVIHAVLLQRQAWNVRGGGYGSEVPGESAQLFRERLGEAVKVLEAGEAAGKESPIWWWAALIVAGSSGQPPAQLDALFEQAVARFPGYQPLYYTRMNYLLPQWGGSYEAVDGFVRQAVERTGASEGSAFYAWLYVDVVRKHRDGDPFAGTQLRWPAMKKAFEDLVSRHPDAWNRNLFATFACRARDRETTARLLVELGPAAKLGAWSPGYSTQTCQRFALEGT